jgi:hypothetical protein
MVIQTGKMKMMDEVYMKVNHFLTCHLLRYPRESNQPRNILHLKFDLEGFHSHLHGEHTPFDFFPLNLEKLTVNLSHEAE